MTRPDKHLPLVYSCSGCSSAAQTANALALRLDHEGEARMSCIAGVGADIPRFVREAVSGRPILALDGCPLACVRETLKRHGVAPDHYVQLSEQGVKKRYGASAQDPDVTRLYPHVRALAKGIRAGGDTPTLAIAGPARIEVRRHPECP
ncbi:MAG TPA: putative zinc-binding protein [Thiobacillaceae bacterium]|nr:putative zinc-binding protein [Thiobacillaceae bacterium]